MQSKSNYRGINGITEKPPPIQRLIFGCLFPIMIVQGIWVRIMAFIPALLYMLFGAKPPLRKSGIDGDGIIG